MEFIETTEQIEENYDCIETACDEIYDTLSEKGATCRECGRPAGSNMGGLCARCV